MQIEVKLYGQLRRYRPQGMPGEKHHPFPYAIQEGATAVALVKSLGIPEGLVNATAVNGEAADPETTLHEGDKVSLFPPSAGG